MNYLILLPFIVVSTDAAEPRVSLHVETVVSHEVPFRHDVVYRAILSRGETHPYITIEIIDWRLGMGGQKMISQKDISIEGQQKICPDPAESWCGKIDGIKWKEKTFLHKFTANDIQYSCRTPVSDETIGATVCSPSDIPNHH